MRLPVKLMVALIAVPLLLVACSDYSDGSRTGVVRKFSKKGAIFKTYEGELVLQGYHTDRDTNGAVVRA